MISNFAHTTTSSVVLLNTRVVSIVFFSLIKGILALGTYTKLFLVKTVNNF